MLRSWKQGVHQLALLVADTQEMEQKLRQQGYMRVGHHMQVPVGFRQVARTHQAQMVVRKVQHQYCSQAEFHQPQGSQDNQGSRLVLQKAVPGCFPLLEEHIRNLQHLEDRTT